MSLNEQTVATARPSQRIGWLDAARGLALLAMASYHLTWDLEYFGYLEPGTAGHGPFKIYARMIATTFLFLAGFGMALGHSDHIRWDRFWIRFAKVAGAAALVSIATYVFMPDAFIHFGILHEIAAGSLICLLFLRLPAWIGIPAAAGILILPNVYRSALFDSPFLWWTGLGTAPPISFDYVPVFPWLAAVLAGLTAGRLAGVRRWLAGLASPARGLRPFAFAGRHSLVVYLLHQVPLFGLVYLISLVAPPDREAAYIRECEQSCTLSASGALCQRFCACTLDQLKKGDLLEPLQTGKLRAEDPRVQSLALQCSAEAQTPPQ